MPDFSKPLDIIVIGGSLAGLFASIPLLRLPAHHHITILERSPTPLLHNQGAGVVAGGETLAFFNHHDVFRRDIGVTSKARYYLDLQGNVMDSEGYKQRMTSWDLMYFLARGNFDGVRSDYVGKERWEEVGTREEWGRVRYTFGREVTRVREEGDKVLVEWKSVRDEGEGNGEKVGVFTADFLICADGPSSRLRGMVIQGAKERVYAGYVAFRGTVPEGELTEAAKEAFVEKFTFYHSNGVQILAYTIPGRNGSLEPGRRLVNWVWYWNCEEESEQYTEIMTDSDGNFHRFTLPTGGKMNAKVWERQKQRAIDVLPHQFAEIVEKTGKPFVQAITDVEPPEKGTPVGRLLRGKAVLVGDALAGFRPHTAASTSQAAYHALCLEKVFAGEIEWKEYERRVLEFGWSWQQRGVMLGERSQFGRHPLAKGRGGEKVSREELDLRDFARDDHNKS